MLSNAILVEVDVFVGMAAQDVISADLVISRASLTRMSFRLLSAPCVGRAFENLKSMGGRLPEMMLRACIGLVAGSNCLRTSSGKLLLMFRCDLHSRHGFLAGVWLRCASGVASTSQTYVSK